MRLHDDLYCSRAFSSRYCVRSIVTSCKCSDGGNLFLSIQHMSGHVFLFFIYIYIYVLVFGKEIGDVGLSVAFAHGVNVYYRSIECLYCFVYLPLIRSPSLFNRESLLTSSTSRGESSQQEGEMNHKSFERSYYARSSKRLDGSD